MFVRRDLTDTVPTREGNMHYQKQGSGFPLVLLHPLGTSTWAWHTVIDALSQDYTCYAFDMLGHGLSDKPTRPFNLPDYARALDDACQVLNIHRGHYVGNSVGACLAAEMAATYPERVDKLALVGCPLWNPWGGAQRVADAAADYDDQGLPQPRTLEQLRQRATYANPQPEWLDASNETRRQAGEWVRNLHQSLSYYDLLSRLPLIKATATLVLYGELDTLREGAELLHNNIVNARQTILPGLGHLPQIEGPDAFNATLLPFLRAG